MIQTFDSLSYCNLRLVSRRLKYVWSVILIIVDLLHRSTTCQYENRPFLANKGTIFPFLGGHSEVFYCLNPKGHAAAAAVRPKGSWHWWPTLPYWWPPLQTGACLCMQSRERYEAPSILLTGDWDPFLGPCRGHRLVSWARETRVFPGFESSEFSPLPHPWDTHHQFSLKIPLGIKISKIVFSTTPIFNPFPLQ